MDIPIDLYHCTIKSILSGHIRVWFDSCSASDRRDLQRVVRSAELIICWKLPSLQDIYLKEPERKKTEITWHLLFHLFLSTYFLASIRGE